MRGLRIVLIIVAVACFGVALSYPIRYRMAQESNNSNMEQLSALRAKGQAAAGEPTATPGATEAVFQRETASGAPAAQNRDEAAVTPGNTGDVGEAMPGDEPGKAPPDGTAQPQAPTETASGETAPPSDLSETSPGEGGQAPDAAADESSQAPAFPKRSGDPLPVSQMRLGEGQSAAAAAVEALTEPDGTPPPTANPTPEPTPTPTPGLMDLILGYPGTPSPSPGPTPEAGKAAPQITPEPSPTPNRRIHTGALPYPLKEKVELDLDAMLPELKDIYELNHDLVGWITIPDTVIDYPVVQTQDSEFYLTHDFYGEENVNGQIILDTLCDPYTPSYNLIISGHHMKNGSMFGDLPKYASKGYWASHPFLEFDTLMTRKQYVIFAAFYSADYDEDEEGFRYNANLQYDLEVDQWLAEVRENQLYDTEVEAEFGDEFITLTTCNRARHRNGRFVVVCRKIREGETFE